MTKFPQNVLDWAGRNRLSQALDCIEAQLVSQPDDVRAHYLATVLLCTSGRRELALARLEKIGLAPGTDLDFDSLSLSDLEHWQAAAADFAAGQRAALARAWPATPICSLPRSGSGWFVAMFARLFDLPVGRMCFGRFPDLQAVPGWLARIAEGGATSHDHLPASGENLQLLRAVRHQNIRDC